MKTEVTTTEEEASRQQRPTAHCWLRPINEDDFKALSVLATEDAHALVAPTHVFVKVGDCGQEEIVGCASIASVPVVLPWFHTEKCKARDSLYFINQMENLLANLMPANGPGLIAVPFMQDSPFYEYIEKLGYLKAPGATLTFKKVK